MFNIVITEIKNHYIDYRKFNKNKNFKYKWFSYNKIFIRNKYFKTYLSKLWKNNKGFIVCRKYLLNKSIWYAAKSNILKTQQHNKKGELYMISGFFSRKSSIIDDSKNKKKIYTILKMA